MLTGDLRNKVDQVWNAFWSGGIANPIEVIEQITYLLFLRALDSDQTREDNKALRLKTQPVHLIPTGTDAQGRPHDAMRWSRFKNMAPAEMFDVLSNQVFPFLRGLQASGGPAAESAFAHHMRDARFTIPTPGLLAKVVDLLDTIPLDDRDTKGDLYEYMLGKIATAGQNGQFRTPRHIIRLMVELMKPTPKDTICDPAAGTAGFLVAAGEYLRDNEPGLFRDEEQRRHFHGGMFNGFDFDRTMLRIGSMNMQLHGIEAANLAYRDSLAGGAHDDAGRYSLILANPPFAGSLDNEAVDKDLLKIVKTKKTELLFMALFLRLLKPGGRAAVIVPDGVLFGSSTAHKAIRKMLVEDHKLDAIVKLPSGVFRPYAGVSTAIVCFTRTDSGGTGDVWFYDVAADGISLDDKRSPLLPPEKLGPVPAEKLSEAKHAKNNLPDVLARWGARTGAERERPRTAQSFCVPKAEIAAAGYDLSINRYKEVQHEAVAHRAPKEIIAELKV
ncbi:MAG: SAM-dependent DNA methyltransferase, partial [Simplicispira sp.]|nr:SAM-dependent DNA methyltransferase [Simplicispira sp.]